MTHWEGELSCPQLLAAPRKVSDGNGRPGLSTPVLEFLYFLVPAAANSVVLARDTIILIMYSFTQPATGRWQRYLLSLLLVTFSFNFWFVILFHRLWGYNGWPFMNTHKSIVQFLTCFLSL